MCEVAKRKMTFDNSNKTKRKHNTRLLNACSRRPTTELIHVDLSSVSQKEMVTTIPNNMEKKGLLLKSQTTGITTRIHSGKSSHTTCCSCHTSNRSPQLPCCNAKSPPALISITKSSSSCLLPAVSSQHTITSPAHSLSAHRAAATDL